MQIFIKIGGIKNGGICTLLLSFYFKLSLKGKEDKIINNTAYKSIFFFRVYIFLFVGNNLLQGCFLQFVFIQNSLFRKWSIVENEMYTTI